MVMQRAEVLGPLLLNGEPTTVGAIVEVDDNTFNNLKRQGILKAAPEIVDESPVQQIVEHVRDILKPKKAPRQHRKPKPYPRAK